MPPGTYSQQPPQHSPQQPPSRPPDGPDGRPGRALTVVAVTVTAAAIIAALFAVTLTRGHGGGSPAGGHTVTYYVAGSVADVTYGPAGSQLSGSDPMKETVPLGDAPYYAITAQLQDYGGSVTCQIGIDGYVVSQATASGDYHIAQCEIVRTADGSWASATGA